jgi:EAL domain-containing protein (putative c-di-GMP-specific phosphodiesterase class I)/GGDEF domain-containing protein
MSAPTRHDDHPGAWVDESERLRAGLLRLRGALHDRVTGLFSYHLYMHQLNSLADDRRIGVVAVDFPALAGLEAAYGWEMSDRFLADAAARLGALRGSGLPESTLLALDGVHGDSFLLFVRETARGEPVTAADMPGLSEAVLRDVRAGLLAGLDNGRPRIDPAVGWALVSDAPAARFERRLHQAIREARAMTSRHADGLVDERGAEVRSILESGRLTTWYQPIVDMEQGTIMGYEALTRGPANTAYERADALFAGCRGEPLLDELDRACRCQAVRSARGLDPRKKLFLNSLPESLGRPGFTGGGFLDALQESALQPRNLVLEITERTSIEDFEAFGRELSALRRQGFLVAIDDVGTGYSSLQTITEIHPDFIKVDLSLVKNIHRSLLKQELVRSLLQAGARIGAQVIAEGIENEEEQRSLRRCGVRYGQGYYFARPAPPFTGLAPRER